MKKDSLRKAILRRLCTAFPGAVSGEQLAEELQVSRVAVWKTMQSLKERGFPLQSSRAGYALQELPDLLFGEYLEVLLGDCFPALRVLSFEELPSTNIEAKRLAQEGYPEGTLVVTERQTAGRGRLGRKWFSEEKKSLTFSLLLRPSIAPEGCPALGLLVALALALALEELGFMPHLKWPNDLYLGGKKVAGILLESSLEMDRVEWVVVGVGVNVNGETFPVELRSRATSLFLEKGEALPRWQVLRAFLDRLGREYPRFGEVKSFAPWVEAFSGRCLLLGKEVVVTSGGVSLRGLARSIDAQGALYIEREGKAERIGWGEVSLFG